MGSSLKICLVDQGSADVYPRLGPTSEWDTAAAHCVLKEAGGDIVNEAGHTLRYNTKQSLLNPSFFATVQKLFNWSEFL
jgi:3'(2'), 5'-bisphosphate nucleotidase